MHDQPHIRAQRRAAAAVPAALAACEKVASKRPGETLTRNAHAPKEHANWLALFGGAQDLPSQIHPDWKHFAVVLTPTCSWKACRCTISLTHLSTPNMSKHHSTQSAGRCSQTPLPTYLDPLFVCVTHLCTKHVCELERKQRWVDYRLSGTSCDDDDHLNTGYCTGDFGAIAEVAGSTAMDGEKLFYNVDVNANGVGLTTD